MIIIQNYKIALKKYNFVFFGIKGLTSEIYAKKKRG